MKLAISLPDDVFRDLDARARRLRTTRSALIARGARELLLRLRSGEEVTRAWNDVLDRVGQPGDEKAARALRRKSKQVIRRYAGGRW